MKHFLPLLLAVFTGTVLAQTDGLNVLPTQAELDAADDTRAFVARVSVVTVGDNGATNATVPDAATVRNAMTALYAHTGRAALCDAWFLSTSHNVLDGTAVPAFRSAANDGVAVNSPAFDVNGATFTEAAAQYIRLPATLDESYTDFTDIAIARPSSEAGYGVMGNAAPGPGDSGSGYAMILRDHPTPNAQVAGMFFSGANAEGFTGIYAKPAGTRWQCVATSYVSGTQKVFLDGRLVATGASTQAIATENVQSVLGASGYSVPDQTAANPFEGQIVFACRLRGIFSNEAMARLVAALRAILSPENGAFNFVTVGDSRIGGTTGAFLADITSIADENGYWQNQLMLKSNWAGKAASFKLGIPSFTAHGLVSTGHYEQLVRQFRPGWQTTYLVFFAGINDWVLGTGDNSAQYVYNRTAEYVAQAKADGMRVIVLGQPAHAEHDAKVRALNALFAATPLGGSWADFYIPIYDAFPVGPLYDGLHFTVAGNTALADLINATVLPSSASLAFGAPPANDNFSAAEALPSQRTLAAFGTTLDATEEVSDPPEAGSGTVWYEWMAPLSGLMRLKGVPDDGQLAGYLAVGDNVLEAKYLKQTVISAAPMQFYAVAGKKYRFCIDDRVPGALALEGCRFQLGLKLKYAIPKASRYIEPLTNDDFRSPLVLTQALEDFVLYTRGSTFEPFERDFLNEIGWLRYNRNGEGGLWMEWKAPFTGTGTLVAKTPSGSKVVLQVGVGNALDTVQFFKRKVGAVSFRCRKDQVYRLYLLSQEDNQVRVRLRASRL